MMKNIFGTNVVIEHCPLHSLYAQPHIIENLTSFVRQFSNRSVPEQEGKANTSARHPEGEITHLSYLQPLMGWIRNAVWNNRHFLKNGKDATNLLLKCSWANEMFEGCSGKVHAHDYHTAVFYVRVPRDGADIIFENGSEKIAANVNEGDLIILEPSIFHSISEHKSRITRICIIIEFDFVNGLRKQ